MKQKRLAWVAGGVCLAALSALAAAAVSMSVQVRKAELRDTPSFVGNVVGSLAYGDKVSVEQQTGTWCRVSAANGHVAGWLHNSALTRKSIAMSAGEGTRAGASSGEMALAGKGFNADVEAQFKAAHKNVDFTWIDRMEGFTIAPAAIRAFVREGALKPEQGGAR